MSLEPSEEEGHTVIKRDLPQECKADLTYSNQSI